MTIFNSRNRPQLLQKLTQDDYDLFIIGGGITGAGIALDAASRGLKTALFEKKDFASGTSSKSTKLIHGGLRYLKQFEIALVREVGRERAIVHRLAPHLVKPEKMLLPLIKGGTYGRVLTSFGLMVYDVLAGVEKADQRKMLSREETLRAEPLLDESIVDGGGLYAEYRTDDARLTLEIMKTAANQFGADMINYAEVTDFLYENGKIAGLIWTDQLTGNTHQSRASYTISAAGPWVDRIRERNRSLSGKKLRPTKGVHVVVPHEKFPVRQSVYFDMPDKRMIFAIPRDRVTYIGTTDTDYHGDLDDVRTAKEDVRYLIEGIRYVFPKVHLTVDDVESSWAGLRPLIGEDGKSASEVSRKDEIFESETGLLSIAGGKLTGYRMMAKRIIDRLAKNMERDQGRKVGPCITQKIVISGGPFAGYPEVLNYEQDICKRLEPLGLKEYATYLVSTYGRQCETILENLDGLSETDPEVRLALAELRFTLDHEAVFTALDFFERRTGRLYFYIGTIPKLREPILHTLEKHLGWDGAFAKTQQAELDRAIAVASEFT